MESVVAEIEAARLDGDREALRRAMKPGAARNALDCALWDLEAKRRGEPAWELAGLPAAAAGRHRLHAEPRRRRKPWRKRRERAAGRPLLKLKLGGDGDPERLRAVRAAAPEARARRRRQRGVERSEFRREHAGLRRGRRRADRAAAAGRRRRHARATSRTPCRSAPTRACMSTADLDALAGKYDAVNVKLDKAGGLTEALDLVREARRRGFQRHGRLHGRHLARHGAGDAPGAGGGLRRSRRAAAPGAGPRAGPRLFRRAGRAAERGALGLKPARQAVARG